MTNTTIAIPAARYEHHDDCLAAAAGDYVAEHPKLEGWDLEPRWKDDRRDEILLTVPEWAVSVQCECGDWSGEACVWTGPKSETVVVEYMPNHLRASHVAAGNSGVHPHNGSQRIHVERSCADRMVECDGEWCSVVL